MTVTKIMAHTVFLTGINNFVSFQRQIYRKAVNMKIAPAQMKMSSDISKYTHLGGCAYLRHLH